MSPEVLVRRWRNVAILAGLLLVHLFVYMTQPDRENSRAFLILAGLTVLFSLCVIGLSFWLNPIRMERLRVRVQRIQSIVIGLLLALCMGIGLILRPEWFYAHLAITFGLTCALVYATLYPDQPLTYPRRWALAGLLLAAVVFVIRAGGLSAYPFIHSADEGWGLSWAADIAHTGILRTSDSLMLGTRTAGTMFIYLPMGFWLRLTGVGFWEARLFSLMLSLPVVLFTGFAARRASGSLAGWFAAFALLISGVLATSARVRHDVGLAMCIALSIWLYLEAVYRQRLMLHFLAGLALGLGLTSHLHTVLFGPVFTLCLYGVPYLERVRKGRFIPDPGFLTYVLGGVLAGGVVFLISLTPLLTQVASTQGYLAGKYTVSPNGILTYAVQHVLNIAVHSQVEFLLVLTGFGTAIVRRRQFDVVLVALFVLGHGVLGFVDPSPFYVIPLTPIYGLLVGLMLADGINHATRGSIVLRHYVMAAYCILLPALGLSVSGPLGYVLQGQPLRLPPPPAAQWVIDHAQPDDVIISEHYYEFWLHEYRFGSAAIPEYATSDTRAQYPTDEAIWDSLNVDYFIFDPTLSTYGTAQRIIDSGYLDSRGYTIVAEFPSGDQTVTIYGHAP